MKLKLLVLLFLATLYACTSSGAMSKNCDLVTYQVDDESNSLIEVSRKSAIGSESKELRRYYRVQDDGSYLEYVEKIDC